ncbi:MAG: succinylglutamate desuccinylase/aspartoacylase family protein, partial [Desulfobacterales bacterium]|nr:succinylglutamate desuccinylase/aspartoacylase family protein [Desulfobacterales bacterium]
ADIADEETLRLARAFQVPVVINAATRDGSLRQAAADEGVCSLLYEGGEALRFDEVAVRAGLRGALAVMEAVGMLRPARRRKPPIDPLIADSTSWVRAPLSGILQMTSHLGGRVAKNARIGIIADPFGATEEDIRSPVSGMVIGRLNLPLVHQGDAVIHIAHLDRLKGIKPIVEEFRDEISEEHSI